MPLKLTVGLSKKVGLPNYGSLGASCGLEVELPDQVLNADPEAFERQVRDAFAACARAVQEELEQHRPPLVVPHSDGHRDHDDFSGEPTGHPDGTNGRRRRQVKATVRTRRDEEPSGVSSTGGSPQARPAPRPLA